RRRAFRTLAAPLPPPSRDVPPAHRTAMKLGRTASVLVCLVLGLGVEAATLRLGAPWDGGARRLLVAYAVAGLLYVAAVLALRPLPTRRAGALILTGAAAFQALAVCFVPTTTDDYYRYVWDGTVQAHGVDPYRYAPLDPE